MDSSQTWQVWPGQGRVKNYGHRDVDDKKYRPFDVHRHSMNVVNDRGQRTIRQHEQFQGAKHTTSGNRDQARNMSDNRRPATPVPSLVASDTVSPPSILTISPTSPPPPHIQRSVEADTERIMQARRPALKLDKPLNKRNIGPPLPSPVNMAFNAGRTYVPRRAAPTKPESPAQSNTGGVPTALAEVSVMEWEDDDENEISVFSRMKRSLNFRPPKHPANPGLVERPRHVPKSPDRQENATPRPQPATASRHSPTGTLGDRHLPLVNSNFSRPKRARATTSPQATLTSGSSTNSKREAFYQGPDVMSTMAQPAPQSSGSNSKSRRQPSETEHYPTLKCRIRSTSLDCRHPSGFLANEATALVLPTPGSTTTNTFGRSSPERPTRFKAFVQGLIRRASPGSLRKNKEDVMPSTSPFTRGGKR